MNTLDVFMSGACRFRIILDAGFNAIGQMEGVL
jgi:hypothetical protein